VVRLTSSAVALCALGFSAVVHAAALLAPLVYFGHSAAPGAAETVVDLAPDETVLEPQPEPIPTALGVSVATVFPNHTHPYPVPAGHDATPHDPNLVHPHATPPALAAPAAASPVSTTTDDTPSFTVVVGPSHGDSFGAVAATGTAAPHVDPSAVVSEQAVDTRARLVHGHPPSYPPEAREDGIEGDVGLELVVGDTGAVESARVVRGMGHGLDDAALQAARAFQFAPAMKDGHAVRVRMAWSMQFRLQ
jgi:protein TonB